MTIQHNSRVALVLLFCTFGSACGSEDDDGDDGATAPSSADDSSSGDAANDDGPMSSTTAPSTTTTSPTTDDSDPADDSGDSGDAESGSAGEFECGEVQIPQYCVDIIGHYIDCDPLGAPYEQELIGECACNHDELNQTAECLAGLDAYAACILATPCAELAEHSCEDVADEAACDV